MLNGAAFCDKMMASDKQKGEKMKKIMNKITFASIVAMTSAPAFAAGSPLCELISKMHDVFNILRTLAFVGAAFYVAGWAWGFISGGKVDVKDIKDKGTGLLVGFVLLFAIGVLLSFVMSASGARWLDCVDILKTW